MLNTVAGTLGLVLQATLFLAVYLACAPRRGRCLAALYAGIAAVHGYSLVLLGALTIGVPWQVANVGFAAGLAGILMAPRVRRATTRSFSALLALLRRHWAALALVVLVVLFLVLVAALLPEVSVDGQLYHGPTLAALVQNGTVWGWRMPNQYSAYSDLAMVGSINLATFTGRAWFDNAGQIPHLVVLVLVVVAAFRNRFTQSWVRVALALLIVTAPVIWIQTRLLYVDVAYGAAVAAIIVLLATQRRASGVDVLFAAIAGAAVLAIKPAGIVTSALLLSILAVVAVVRRRREMRSWGRTVWPVLAAIAAPSILALGFYFRNLVEFGNPVFPVKVSMGPISFPGIIDLSVFTSGERGSGVVDPLRWATYVASILDGVQHGVLKLDYDPRSGGFGWMPLLVLAAALVSVVIQAALAARRGGRGALSLRGNVTAQAGLLALAALVLLVQPSTFDTRYVIGPTVVICVAVLLTTVARAAVRAAEVCVGVLALIFGAGQAVWVEANVYPGLAAIRELRTLPERWQPITPGNPWGRGESVAWLPDDPTQCARIVLQTEGGIGETGMRERSAIATLPYGLYGAALCNVVIPVQLNETTAGLASENPLPTADFLLLYSKDVPQWEAQSPETSRCWRAVQTIDPDPSAPDSESLTVLRVACD
ncbi:hypothetical protein JVX92_05540 [Microbacterium hominis]|uniref:hypothetical protein n=1 Tax=Microbacterium hominis TaxID=162426 RepID=UPI001963E2BB|nr:hypothetical protein [Microbacterium hominis]QRY41714.1 hypothetical protein JVX92_05540 [Microbacterium hominis]